MPESTILVPKPAIVSLAVHVVGTSPLITNRWSEKAKRRCWTSR